MLKVYSAISGTTDFLNTYNLALQLAFIACLPVFAASKIAIRSASESNSPLSLFERVPPPWVSVFGYTGGVMTLVGLCFCSVFGVDMIRLIFGYTVPTTSSVFLTVFFLCCLAGQVGHFFAIPLRSAGKSRLVALNFLFAEIFFYVAPMGILSWVHGSLSISFLIALTFIYTISFPILNVFSILKVKSKEVGFQRV
jgi:hypothetical protein